MPYLVSPAARDPGDRAPRWAAPWLPRRLAGPAGPGGGPRDSGWPRWRPSLAPVGCATVATPPAICTPTSRAPIGRDPDVRARIQEIYDFIFAALRSCVFCVFFSSPVCPSIDRFKGVFVRSF